jgi:hypothetical protein
MAKSTTKTTKGEHAEPVEIAIERLKQARMLVRIIGTMPLYIHAMSVKAQRSLLLGGGRKTAAERREIKHNPEQEFRDSCYRIASGPTLLGMPAPAPKGAMAVAALVTPGVKKTEVERLIFIPHQMVPVWGKPLLKMDVVRSADQNRTPDIRTRAFLPEWVSEFEIRFVAPNFSSHSVASLVANAGVVCGIGDNRQEKGSGSFGTFDLVTEEREADFERIKAAGGREVQQAAYDAPEAADIETRELLDMVKSERLRRSVLA